MPEQSKNTMRSVRRCFALMELFDREQSPLSASEISNELAAPLSSTIDLLKCVSELGYFAYDSRARTYFPTARLGKLGDWMETNPLHQLNYTELMEDLHEASGETISVFTQSGSEMVCVASIPGTHRVSFNLEPGERLPLFNSAVGLSLLAEWDDSEIEKAYRKTKPGSKLPRLETLRKKITKIRSNGYASGYELVIPDVGAITATKAYGYDQCVVFSVGGLSKRVKAKEPELSKLLLKTLRQKKRSKKVAA